MGKSRNRSPLGKKTIIAKHTVSVYTGDCTLHCTGNKCISFKLVIQESIVWFINKYIATEPVSDKTDTITFGIIENNLAIEHHSLKFSITATRSGKVDTGT